MQIKQQLKQRISLIEKHIADLKLVQNNDMGASYKEASQTNDMIETYQRQVANLLEELAGLDDSRVTYKLAGRDGTKRTFTLVSKGADPFTGRITQESPLGKLLLQAKAGDDVQIGPESFIISSIS